MANVIIYQHIKVIDYNLSGWTLRRVKKELKLNQKKLFLLLKKYKVKAMALNTTGQSILYLSDQQYEYLCRKKLLEEKRKFKIICSKELKKIKGKI